MSREELEQIRDRLLQLADGMPPASGGGGQRLPFNVKRKVGGPLSRQTSKTGQKLSVQDFVRMDPGYTPDIEHLVFPNARRRSPQQVAPAVSRGGDGQLPPPPPPSGSGRTRSRLAEMFALSRHLQRSATERQDSTKTKTHVNRSVDSAVDQAGGGKSGSRQSSSASKRWIYSVDAAVRQQNSVSKGPSRGASISKENKLPTPNRGPNVSILHLRSTSEPWDKPLTSSYAPTPTGRPPRFVSSRSTTSAAATRPVPTLTKHQSLTTQKWSNSPSFHSGSEVNSPGIFTFSGSCDRELSPVRWCDREVDGVYLGKSGWVQVQQRSMEERCRPSYSVNLAKSIQSRRTGIKLANYHCYSEPQKSSYSRNNSVDASHQPEPPQTSVATPPVPRPALLQLERQYKSPPGSPPPSVTPIISPPPAFQDRTTSDERSSPPPPLRSRTFFGKTPFLPRSNAIVDSDNSPPSSPPPGGGGGKWITTAPNAPPLLRPAATRGGAAIRTSPGVEKPPRNFNNRKAVPQTTKSLEETTASRRMQFKHQYGSSSSSSSSMGFRSLDSCLNRTGNVMPRLSEHADVCGGDADDEDNYSSSANATVVTAINPNLLQAEFNKKLSPSGRSNNRHRAQQLRRSPAGSDAKPSPASSSSSSNEFIARSPPTPQHPTVIRRNAAARNYQPPGQEDAAASRVRRSRSLQLPERQPPLFERAQKVSPPHFEQQHQQQQQQLQQQQHRVAAKGAPQYPSGGPVYSLANAKSPLADQFEEELLREAEVVTGFLYGNRSRAAAQALLMHRYNNNNISPEEKNHEANKPALNNELTVYYVGNSRNDRQRVLLRGATSPSLPSGRNNSYETAGPCSPETCDFWPHCAHRESINLMRPSQSYPSHQRSLDSVTSGGGGGDPTGSRSNVIGDQSRRFDVDRSRKLPQPEQQEFRRISPGRPPATGSSLRRNEQPTEVPMTDRKQSPRAGNGGSSSGSEVWFNASRVSSVRNSRASTPVDATISRPGSAQESPVHDPKYLSQQRSMSLPKSFLAGGTSDVYLRSGQVAWTRHGTESISSSPGLVRKIPTPEIAHTAPVTPLHEGRRGRSPSGPIRRTKATSTPHLPEPQRDSRSWTERTSEHSDSTINSCLSEDTGLNAISFASTTNESVLQRFRKTISQHFAQRKPTRESYASDDTASEAVPSDEESSPRHTGSSGDQKQRFGQLIWRTSKERKRLNKTTRGAKCNSGDSGIQIEIPGNHGGTGESSESHDTDGSPSVGSPPILRHKYAGNRLPVRPHSDIVGATCQTDAKQRQHRQTHDTENDDHRQQRGSGVGGVGGGRRVRRTRSDLGGQRLLGWEQRQAARRLLCNMATSRRPLSPRKRPPDDGGNDGAVVLRRQQQTHGAPPRRPALRRSLSQPIDLDKISPVMIVKSTATDDDGHNNHASNNTSDEDTMSDSDVSSIASLTTHKKSSLELPDADEDMIVLAEAVFDHVAIESDELPFRAGDVVEVEDTSDREWWWGSTNGKWGWFPAQFVRLRVSQEDTVEDCLAAIASGRPVSAQIRRRTSVSLLSNDQVRTSVVRELVHTERDFVKVLRDVSEGYLLECRKRKDMFTEERIATIFINLDEILAFQVGFLRDLETRIDWEAPHKSCVGECFLRHSAGFKMYSDYCNSHPLATAALQDLYQYNSYSKFFEACRLMRGLIEIPLDGYLLTPVQRICKYPLQLAELLKYTRPDHEDYDRIKEALEVMRGVATLINERKRRMESLEKLAAWQRRVDGWEGEDLIETSSQLIRQGEVIRTTTGMWTNNVTLFLFDRQLVYCKKDILKRNTYVYKGRICLDTSEIVDVPDGKDSNLNVSVRHAIKLLDGAKDKWFVFCCRSAKEKQRWLEAFEEERKLVVRDKTDGLEMPPAARHLAKIAAYRQKRPPRKIGHLKPPSSYLGSSMTHLNVTASNSPHSLLGRKMATWFNFGGGKKSRHYDSRP